MLPGLLDDNFGSTRHRVERCMVFDNILKIIAWQLPMQVIFDTRPLSVGTGPAIVYSY